MLAALTVGEVDGDDWPADVLLPRAGADDLDVAGSEPLGGGIVLHLLEAGYVGRPHGGPGEGGAAGDGEVVLRPGLHSLDIVNCAPLAALVTAGVPAHSNPALRMETETGETLGLVAFREV